MPESLWAAPDLWTAGPRVRPACHGAGMTPPPLAAVPVRTAAELAIRWQHLLGVPMFTARSLWLTWLDDGLMLPVVLPVDDVPAVPDRPMLADVAHVCGSIAESHASGAAHVAMALCRPGRGRITADDEAWARGLREAFSRADATAGLPWSLHLAAGGAILPVVDLPG